MGTSTSTSSTIVSITGYSAFGQARLGSNGENGGAAELGVGASGGSLATGRYTWSSDISQGVNTGSIPVSFTGNPGGSSNGVAWSVSGGDTDPLLCSASYGAISQVKLAVWVQSAGALSGLNTIVVRFYKNGTLMETINCGDIAADTLDYETDIQEVVMTVTPSASDNTKVVVEANLQFTLEAAEITSPDELFAGVYLLSA
jgi:hypothetical protein